MATVVGIVSGCGLSVHMFHGKYPKKSKLMLYKPLLHCNNRLKWLQLSNKVEGFSYKGDMDVFISSHLKEELA